MQIAENVFRKLEGNRATPATNALLLAIAASNVLNKDQISRLLDFALDPNCRASETAAEALKLACPHMTATMVSLMCDFLLLICVSHSS